MFYFHNGRYQVLLLSALDIILDLGENVIRHDWTHQSPTLLDMGSKCVHIYAVSYCSSTVKHIHTCLDYRRHSPNIRDWFQLQAGPL